LCHWRTVDFGARDAPGAVELFRDQPH
jgi:hypothetical protein